MVLHFSPSPCPSGTECCHRRIAKLLPWDVGTSQGMKREEALSLLHSVLDFFRLNTLTKVALFCIFFSIKRGKQLWSHFCDEGARKENFGDDPTSRFTTSRPWQFVDCLTCKYILVFFLYSLLFRDY